MGYVGIELDEQLTERGIQRCVRYLRNRHSLRQKYHARLVCPNGIENRGGRGIPRLINSLSQSRDLVTAGETQDSDSFRYGLEHSVDVILGRDDVDLREHFGISGYLPLKTTQRVAFRFDFVNSSRTIQNRKICLALTDAKFVQHRRCLKRMLAEEDLMHQSRLVDVLMSAAFALQQRECCLEEVVDGLVRRERTKQERLTREPREQGRFPFASHLTNNT